MLNLASDSPIILRILFVSHDALPPAPYHTPFYGSMIQVI